MQEIERQNQEIEQLKQFNIARKSGRSTLIATSGAGTEAGFRVGKDGTEAEARETSLLDAVTGDKLAAQLKKRGAVSTRTIVTPGTGGNPFSGQVIPAKRENLSLIDFGKL